MLRIQEDGNYSIQFGRTRRGFRIVAALTKKSKYRQVKFCFEGVVGGGYSWGKVRQ
jgi:hypothetical protein